MRKNFDARVSVSFSQSRAATNETQLDADTGLPWCDKWGTRTGLPLRDQRDNPRKRLTWRDLAGVAQGSTTASRVDANFAQAARLRLSAMIAEVEATLILMGIVLSVSSSLASIYWCVRDWRRSGLRCVCA